MTAAAGNEARFWIASLAVHGLVAVAVLLSPAGELVFRSEVSTRPQVIRRGEELADVIDDIRDLTVERLRRNVARLDAGRERMQGNFERFDALYRPYHDRQVLTLQGQFQEEADQTLERQRILVALAVATGEDAARHAALTAALDKHQARIGLGQSEIRRALRLVLSDRADLLAEQQAAEEHQRAAVESLAAFAEARSAVADMRQQLAELDAGLVAARETYNTHQQAFIAADKRRDQAIAAGDTGARRQAERVQETARRARDEMVPRIRSQDAERRRLRRALPATIAERDDSLRAGTESQITAERQQRVVVTTLLEAFEEAARRAATHSMQGDEP